MLLVVIVCVGVAIYCFMNGMVLAGVLSLAGMSPGIGFLTLIAASVILVANEHMIAAIFPVAIIVFNIWGLFALKRGTPNLDGEE